MKYQYGILLTDVSSNADLHNSVLLGGLTLGIEVTSLTLASQCGLGNIDPQHSGNGGSSAIEDALTFPLPPDGAKLVTIRPDKDSFGAMAILTLRAQGKDILIDKRLVAWIGAMDRVGFQNARTAHPHLVSRHEMTDAIQVIVKNTHWSTTEAKIADIGRILTCEMQQTEIDTIAALKPRNTDDFDVEMFGNVAFIVAPNKYGAARDWGNQRYLVTIVFDPEYALSNGDMQERWSVVRQPHVFDRRDFEERINTAEAQARDMSRAELKKSGFTWGGPSNIVSSPLGRGRNSFLSRDIIIAIVRECAESSCIS